MKPESNRHRLYYPGMNVYIDPSILKRHRLSPLAGRVVKVTVYGVRDPAEDYTYKVPVSFDGQVWYVEEEYVFADNLNELAVRAVH